MSVILPAAPTNFYLPSLNELKDKLEETNGQTKGQITLLSAVPDTVNSAWSQVGAGNKLIDSSHGTLVIGQAEISFIAGPSPAYAETAQEYGYKLEFAKITEIEIDLPAGVDSTLLVGFGVIVGRDDFSQGSNDDVKYLGKIEDIVITDVNQVRRGLKSFPGIYDIGVSDGDIIELPEWNLIINYAEPITV